MFKEVYTAPSEVHRAVLGRKEWGQGGGGVLLGWVAGSILVLRNLLGSSFCFSPKSQNADTISP